MSAHHTADSKPRSILPIFVIGLVVLGIFYVLSRYLLGSNPAPDLETERAALRAKNLEELQKDNEVKLKSYAWTDKTSGTVRIPIEKAKELVLPALIQNKPHAAGPIAVTAPAAPATPAAPQASPAEQPSPTPAS